MDEIGLNELLQLIIKEKGGTPQQYNKLMDYIAYHETGPNQRMSTTAKQEGGGPGRGLFQFETGDDKGGNTAVNRTHNYLTRNNLSVPKWLNKMWEGKKSADVSTLNADQQKMLFLGYHKEHPTSNFSNIWSGKQTVDNFWLNNHWAGDATESATKLNLFKKSMLAKDSTDALKVRKAELFGQEDKVPFQSAQNNPNNLPKELDILKRIFGQQTSSIVDKYNHGGVHLPGDEEDNESLKNSLQSLGLWAEDTQSSVINVFKNLKKKVTGQDYPAPFKDGDITIDSNGNKVMWTGDAWVPYVAPKSTTKKKEIPKVTTVEKKPKRKKEKIIKLPSRPIKQILKEEVKLEKAGIVIDESKYTYSKYYDSKRGEYRVRVTDKSRRGKSDSEVDNLSLNMFKEFYRYKQ